MQTNIFAACPKPG